MKTVVLMIMACIISVNASAQSDAELQSIRKLIGSFINDLNKGDFSNLSDYCSSEWIHVNSNGVINYGKDEVVREIFKAYKTTYKDGKITIDQMAVRMLTPETALVTVIHKFDGLTDAQAVKYNNQHQVKTFIVVKQSGKWLLAFDQSTVITPQ